MVLTREWQVEEGGDLRFTNYDLRLKEGASAPVFSHASKSSLGFMQPFQGCVFHHKQTQGSLRGLGQPWAIIWNPVGVRLGLRCFKHDRTLVVICEVSGFSVLHS